ncbi:MAG TPA: inorganic diphosphatase [Geminicoccaceae bacterium]|nr:inorganic diphosphatase [Geminicoccaceae bacterium]
MNIDKIAVRPNPPQEINVIVEVLLRSDPIKHEFDKAAGAIVVDRFLYTTMFSPCNYGFIPLTLAEDGDAVDVMVPGRMPVLLGAVLPARPIGVLRMRDEAGPDEKILAVPLSRITRLWERVQAYRDVAESDLQRIAHYFEHYKDLEPEKWVELKGWGEPDEAHRPILEAMGRI